MATHDAGQAASVASRPADFGPVPVSRFKAESGNVFTALEEGRRVVVSRHGRVVALIDPVDLLPPELLADFARPGDRLLGELSATEINQRSPSAAVTAAENGAARYVTRDGRAFGLLRGVRDGDLPTLAPSEQQVLDRETRVEGFLQANPDLDADALLAFTSEVNRELGIGRPDRLLRLQAVVDPELARQRVHAAKPESSVANDVVDATSFWVAAELARYTSDGGRLLSESSGDEDERVWSQGQVEESLVAAFIRTVERWAASVLASLRSPSGATAELDRLGLELASEALTTFPLLPTFQRTKLRHLIGSTVLLPPAVTTAVKLYVNARCTDELASEVWARLRNDPDDLARWYAATSSRAELADDERAALIVALHAVVPASGFTSFVLRLIEHSSFAASDVLYIADLDEDLLTPVLDATQQVFLEQSSVLARFLADEVSVDPARRPSYS